VIELLLQAEGALSLGLLDRAETLYRQVAGADPRNAIAVVGLARVALERGGESEALELARQALAIDPENSSARRMVQRLEEVLTYRGVDLPVAPATPGPRVRPVVEPKSEPAPKPAPKPEPASTTRQRSLVDRLLRRR
jgi:tetratricopeptide (TPR) repeat protein